MQTPLLDGAKKELLDLIKRSGKLSLDSASEKLGLAKTTIRQHLLALESQSLIKRTYERIGQGRPKIVFELSQNGQRLYPTQEPTLLRELLEYLKAGGQQESIKDFFEKFWDKRRAEFETLLAPAGGKNASQSARIEALRTLLEAEGFMPQITVDSKQQITVSECNCPFREAVNATQLPCKLESEFIRWALRANLTRSSYILSGDPSCSYSGKPK